MTILLVSLRGGLALLRCEIRPRGTREARHKTGTPYSPGIHKCTILPYSNTGAGEFHSVLIVAGKAAEYHHFSGLLLWV